MKEEKHWKRKPSSGLSAQRIYFHPRTAIEAEILFAAYIMHLRFLGAVIKPVHPCTGLIAAPKNRTCIIRAAKRISASIAVRG